MSSQQQTTTISSQSISSSLNPTSTNTSSSTSSKSFVQRWEQLSKLSPDQHARVVEISKICTGRPVNKIYKDEPDEPKTDPLQEIENMQQFYEWFSEIQENIEHQEEERYIKFLSKVKDYSSCCSEVLEEIDASLSKLQTLKEEYKVVSKKTGDLSDACQALLQEQEQLISFHSNLKDKLSIFNELDRITSLLHSMMNSSSSNNTLSTSSMDDSLFSLLKRLDHCIQFVQENASFMEAEVYLLKFRQLQMRALTDIKNQILNNFRNITNQIILSGRENNPILTQSVNNNNNNNNSNNNNNNNNTHNSNNSNINSFHQENSLIYLKFKALSPKIKPLCEEIENRSTVVECLSLLNDCHYSYFQQRRMLLAGSVYKYIEQLSKNRDLTVVIRDGCSYLINLCHLEYNLFHYFFNNNVPGLKGLLEGFSSLLYDLVRPLFIHSHDIDTLCSIVDILRTEIIEEQIERKGKSVAAFQVIVTRMIEDAQERLIFLTQTYIRDHIHAFIPEPHHLDYPNILIKHKQQQLKQQQQQQQQQQQKSLMNGDGNDFANDVLHSLYSTWYPTLERTLMCLSKLYLSVDTKIFQGLAQEAVSVCTASLVYASKLVTNKNSFVHGQLFLVRHLLILRNQITPFDIDFLTVERALDFGSLQSGFGKIFSGQFFGLNSNLRPKITNMSIDSKKDLERTLVSTIENFISTTIRISMEPLVSFVTKSTTIQKVLKEGEKLSTQSFATPLKIKELLQLLYKLSEQKFPEYINLLHIYLDKQNNLLNLIKMLKEASNHYFDAFEGILESYSIEELKQIDVNQYYNFKRKVSSILDSPPTQTVTQLNTSTENGINKS